MRDVTIVDGLIEFNMHHLEVMFLAMERVSPVHASVSNPTHLIDGTNSVKLNI